MTPQDAREPSWVPQVSRMSWWQRLWKPFWAVPCAMAVAAVAFGLGLPLVDETVWPWAAVLFQGGPDSARSVLGTITSAMISVTGLVFSVTMVVLQLASSQFSPRVLGSFLDSRITQVTLGVFTGTFIYSLTVLRSVRGAAEGDDAFVPQLATSAAYVLVVASVSCFLAFIHHITMSIQVQEVVARTLAATTTTLDRMIPADQHETGRQGRPPRWSPSAEGTPTDVFAKASDQRITDIDYRRIVSLAERHDVVVTIDKQVGDYVVTGVPLAQIQHAADAPVPDALMDDLRGLITLNRDRSLRQDVAFGLRQLVDIAERALSPGINDPTTATQAIDALHSILRRAVQRPVPSGHAAYGEGVTRLIYRPQSVEQLLELAFTELAHWGSDSTRIPDCLREVLDDLGTVALPPYRGPIHRMRRLIDDKESR